MNPLPGKKTFIISMLYGVAAIIEIFGVFDFPFITDPWMQVQIAMTAILVRLGVLEAENAVKNGS